MAGRTGVYDDAVTRLPTLGPRGEGWVLLQLALLAATAVGGLTGPAWSGALRTVTSLLGAGLMLGGSALAAWGVVDLRHALTPFPKPLEGAGLIQDGAFRLVRHPIYGGLVQMAAGWALLTAAPLAFLGAAALLVLLDLKSRREEAWLVREHPGYEAYRRRTRRMVPRIY
jgi:protein-S-isoprenylcysteine O-methyltransferase Ste14